MIALFLLGWAACNRPCPLQQPPGATLAGEGASTRKLLADASAALGRIRRVRYSARHTVTLTGARATGPIATVGTVLLEVVETGRGPRSVRFRMVGRLLEAGDAGEDVPFELSYDGEFVRAWIGPPDEQSRAIWEGRVGEGGDDLLELGEALRIPAFHSPNPLAEELQGSSLAVLPDAVVGETPCKVVSLVYGDGPRAGQRADWFLGARDHLPRRVERSYEFAGIRAQEHLTVTRITTDVRVAADDFQLPVPEGWTLRRYGEHDHHHHPLEVGSIAPDFTLEDPSGEVHSLSALRGQVVLLDFWATWCGPCRVSMPAVERLHQRFLGRGVTVYGLSTWDDGDPEGYVRTRGYTYGLLLEAEEVAERYGVTGLPTFYVVGADGRVLATHVGFEEGREAEIATVIQAELARRDG